jgi:hypothetical protein
VITFIGSVILACLHSFGGLIARPLTRSVRQPIFLCQPARDLDRDLVAPADSRSGTE